MFSRPVQRSTMILTTIALLDLLTTILFLGLGYSEGNPLFRMLLARYGAAGFIGGKVVLLALPIVLLEYVRQSHPKSAEQGTWLAVAFYCAFYALNLLGR